MVHWHCGRLHSAARQHANRHLIQQWQTFLLHELENQRTTRYFPTRRSFSTCSCRAENRTQPIESLDTLRSFSKKAAQRRIPPSISSKFDSHVLPPQAMSSAITIQSHLENGDRTRALEAFESIAHLPHEYGIPRNIAQQLLACLRADIRADTGKKTQLQRRYHRPLELLLTHVRALGYHWDDNEFRVILELFDRMDLVERAEVVFRSRDLYCNQLPNILTYNKLAAAYLRRIKHLEGRDQIRYMDKLNTLIKSIAKHGLKPDIVTFNLLLSARARLGCLQSIEQTFDEMERHRVKPNDRTLNIALDIYGKLDLRGNLEQALSSILKSMGKSKQSPDVITYATTIRNAVLNRDLRTAERTFKAMMEKGVMPNEYVFAHLAVGYVQLGDMDKAHAIIQMMRASPFNLQPTVHVFTPLIQGYAKSFEYDKAYNVFSDMVDQGIPANLTTYTILATMFVDSPIYENPLQAINVLRGLSKLAETDQALDQAALTVLIEAHGVAGARDLDPGLSDTNVSRRELHARAAKECYDTIVRQYGKPDNVAHTVLLTAYARMNLQDKAWEFWQQLKDVDATVTTIHYNALFMGLINEKKWLARAKEAFDEMIHGTESVRPDIATYDLLIQGAYDAGDLDWIRTLWKLPFRPKSVGDSPDSAKLLVRTYYYALHAMLVAEDASSAQDIFKEFKSLPLAPASATIWSHRIHQIAQFHPLDNPTPL
ncbi:hypothetical protein BJV82DRAFT_620072 [Fennellomyces sp. T-0311]|nr:hypothetical protein BJV82DRAFT_620072 [Fennellomyces sp. T-0311]